MSLKLAIDLFIIVFKPLVELIIETLTNFMLDLAHRILERALEFAFRVLDFVFYGACDVSLVLFELRVHLS